jgi:hypothetical protein
MLKKRAVEVKELSASAVQKTGINTKRIIFLKGFVVRPQKPSDYLSVSILLYYCYCIYIFLLCIPV